MDQEPDNLIDKDVTIIIAEDDYGHFTLTERCLRKAGITNEILRFKDGESLLEFLESGLHGSDGDCNKPDFIILLGIELPNINGIEILRSIREIDGLRHIHIIMLSYLDDSDVIDECFMRGCNGYVQEPPGQNLMDAIKKASHCLAI